MRMDRYLPPGHPLSKIYRAGAALFGAFLVLFGGWGLASHLPLLSTEGIDIAGLSSNGALAWLSVAVGLILIIAAAWGGPVASTTTTVVGVLFFLSGLVNLALLDTGWNLLAFKLSNVVFSLIAGMLLVFLGTYGRVSGGLAQDNPYVRYRHHEPPESDRDERSGVERKRIAELEPLCEAEIAVAEGHPTPEQERMVLAAMRKHLQAERRRAYEHYRKTHPGEEA